jgi:predicted AAA+ superfamily ATPase
MFQRQLNVPKSNRFFLFGPRGTGKSTLVKSISDDRNRLYINLLLSQDEDFYGRNPDELLNVVRALPAHVNDVIIDEIQKVPKLLDVVHELIETTPKRFILTGSSARKLKSGAANLLAGRAFSRQLLPLTYKELGDRFSIDDAMRWGTLPKVFGLVTDQDKSDYLVAYSQTYLKEEVWGEQLIRKMDPFRKFLEIAAQSNGKIINFSNIARDTGVDSKTIKSYFEILEDTLVGFFLEAYSPNVRKAVYKSPKFYFFDIGVTRALSRILDVLPKPATSYYGESFEHLVILELYKQLLYSGKQYRLSYLRTQADNEIDLIVDRPGRNPIVIEIKSTREITEEKLRSMKFFNDEFPDAEFLCLSQDPVTKKYDRITAIHWLQGIDRVFVNYEDSN